MINPVCKNWSPAYFMKGAFYKLLLSEIFFHNYKTVLEKIQKVISKKMILKKSKQTINPKKLLKWKFNYNVHYLIREKIENNFKKEMC